MELLRRVYKKNGKVVDRQIFILYNKPCVVTEKL